jgi:hypothetical protein
MGEGNMKQAMIDYTKNKKFDHFDTPAYAVRPLLPYIPKSWVIWEPTDTTGKSQIARVFRDNGNVVMSTGFSKLDFYMTARTSTLTVSLQTRLIR